MQSDAIANLLYGAVRHQALMRPEVRFVWPLNPAMAKLVRRLQEPVNLVIINLIPIPALDGGRLLVVAIEALARRTVPKLLMQTFNMIGVALIILLMITVTYNDVARLLA